MFKRILICLVMCTLVCSMFASLEKKLQELLGKNAEMYLEPLANTIGAGLNVGQYNNASTLPPLTFSVRVGSGLISIPSSDKTFYAAMPDGEKVKTATIFGKEGASHTYTHTFTQTIEGVGEVSWDQDIEINLPQGWDDALPFVPVPNVSVFLGLPMGNELMLRYLPPMKLPGDLGDATVFGIGVKHSIDQYLPSMFPVHLAVQGSYQNIEIGDIVKINATSFNAIASKKLLMLTLYGSVGVETSSLSVKYTYQPTFDSIGLPIDPTLPIDPSQLIPELEPIPISLNFNGANDVRTTLGIRYAVLPFISVYGDVTAAKYSSYNVGLGIGF